MQKLTPAEKRDYLEQIVVPGFLPLVDKEIHTAIYDDKCKLVISTNFSARSMGYDKWQEMVGLGYNDRHHELFQKVFQDKYTEESSNDISKYCDAIFKIQLAAIRKEQIISMFDLLPYNGTFKSYLVLHTPIFHPNGEVVGLQSFSHESKFFGFKEHFFQTNEITKITAPSHIQVNLTKREEEVIFLLANGLTQEQISRVLNLSRSTIANLIANQLSEKFNISGANTHLLTKIAVESGLFQQIPESLYRPFVVSLFPDEILDTPEE